MSSLYDANVKSPVLSPSTNEFSESQITDENSKTMDLIAAVQIDVNGHSNMGAAVYANGHASQVTDKQEGAIVTCPGGEKVRLKGLVSLDSSGNPVPFSLKAKFQSTVQTGTGSAQSIPHGLGVVPSLVLVSPYNVPSAEAFAISEGTHTNTNLLVTATTGVQYKVICFA